MSQFSLKFIPETSMIIQLFTVWETLWEHMAVYNNIMTYSVNIVFENPAAFKIMNAIFGIFF